jgi:asparaginyl-tRNA synthetase
MATTGVRVADALDGRVPVGSTVTVKGWARSRRDSKAGGGLTFLALHDGSCFAPIQVVARPSLPNY